MNIEQIAVGIKDSHGLDMSDEAAITLLRHALSKLAEQAEEPVAWRGKSGHLVYDKDALMPSTRHLATPLYTESQLLAAQQRTAKACVKAVFEQAKYFGYNVHAEAVRDAALSKWREYL